MRFSEFKKLSPPKLPVASIPFGEIVLDIFPLRSKDVFWLINVAPQFVDAYNDMKKSEKDSEKDETETVSEETEVDSEEVEDTSQLKILNVIGTAGPEVITKLIAIALRASVEEVEEQDFSLAEEKEIILNLLEFGIPENFFPELILGLKSSAKKIGFRQG